MARQIKYTLSVSLNKPTAPKTERNKAHIIFTHKIRKSAEVEAKRVSELPWVKSVEIQLTQPIALYQKGLLWNDPMSRKGST